MTDNTAVPTVGKRLAAGSMAGMVAITVCHPFDTLRTRLQSSSQFSSLSQVLRQTVRSESVFALYRGFWPPFFSQGLYKGIIFTVSSFVRDQLEHVPLLMTRATTISILSGAAAGMVNSFVVTPIELVRNRLQIQGIGMANSASYNNSLDCIMQVIRSDHGGIRSLWRGNTATIARDTLGMAAYFTAYDTAKKVLSPHFSETLTTLLAGACGGLGFWVLALPLDTIKTLIQIDSPLLLARNSSQNNNSLAASCLHIYRTYGLQYFFRGWQVAFSRGIPSAAITFFVYNNSIVYLTETLNEATSQTR